MATAISLKKKAVPARKYQLSLSAVKFCSALYYSSPRATAGQTHSKVNARQCLFAQGLAVARQGIPPLQNVPTDDFFLDLIQPVHCLANLFFIADETPV